MYSLISFTLLLFEIGCSFGHTLPRKEILNNMDVYSVHENNHDTLTFVNPKSMKPTVKEIIFYHFIEKPYDQSQVVITHKEETIQGPDSDASKRPFTNGHSVQIHNLDSDEDDDDEESSGESIESVHESDEDVNSDADKDKHHDDTESAGDDSDSDDDKSGNSDITETKSDSDEVDEEDEDIINANDRIGNAPAQDDVIDSSKFNPEFEINKVKESVETSTNEMMVNREDLNAGVTTTETVMVITEPVATTVLDDVENEKIAERNIIFNQLRNRYQETWNPTIVSSRKKRDLEYSDSDDADIVDGKELPEMPEAPVLPELDLDELRKNLTDENIRFQNPEYRKLYNNNDEAKRIIVDDTEDINSEVKKSYEEGEYISDTLNRPRTYGMELNNGAGYVWNELAKLPETPISSEMNLDEIPENTRDIISSESQERPEMRNFNHETQIEIEDGTEKINSEVAKPFGEEEKLVSDLTEEAPYKPRTYGMELKNGTGYVWNELTGIPETPILPEPNFDRSQQNINDFISSEKTKIPEMPEAPIIPKVNFDNLPENTRDEISFDKSELTEMSEAPITPELNSDELSQNTRDDMPYENPEFPDLSEAAILSELNTRDGISSEKPELPEMPESPFLPELNTDELPQNSGDVISTENPELPKMPEAPILPELNLDELPLPYNKDETSSEIPRWPGMPEAPILPELNIDELPKNIEDVIFTEKPEFNEMPTAPISPELNYDKISFKEPELPEMPESPILPEPNINESQSKISDVISTESPELTEMPEAPISPKLNLDEFPLNIRDVISTETPEHLEEKDEELFNQDVKINSGVVKPYEEREDVGHSTDEAPQNPSDIESNIGTGYNWNETPDHNNDEESEKDIEHRIDEMISEVMRPYEDGDVGDSKEPKKPRTYGMKLKNGAGYVWNDLWGNPGMSFDVGHTSRSKDNEENITKKDEPEETQDSDNSSSDLYTTENIGDIQTDKNNDYFEHEENDKENNDTKTNYETLIHDERNEDENENKSFETVEDNSFTTEQSTFDLTEAYYNDTEPLEEVESVTEKQKTHQPKRIESILEILKNQDNDFWIWLQDWTATYMDLLMRHIKKIVEQEVRKQLNLSKIHQDDEKLPNEMNTYFVSQQHGKEMTNVRTHDIDDTKPIDGTEIPVTHNTNFDISDILNDDRFTEIYDKSGIDLRKGRRHKKKDKETIVAITNAESVSDQRKPNKEGKVDANNIFGNSYNNDKVTNIYIFYPKDDSEKIIKDEKNNKSAFIFEKPECTKIEEREPTKEELKPITENFNERTTPINPTEGIIQPTESSSIGELETSVEPDEKAEENERDNQEILQSSTSKTPVANVDIEMTTYNIDNEHNTENLMDKDGEGISEIPLINTPNEVIVK